MNMTMVAHLHAKAVLPALLVANIVEGSMADGPAPTVVVGHSSDAPTLRPEAADETEARPMRLYHEAATEWTKTMARRFRELARKEALGTLAPEESVELERLTRDRRNLEYPRPVEEVLWEVNQRQVTANLVRALKDYVEFHQAPGRTRTGAS